MLLFSFILSLVSFNLYAGSCCTAISSNRSINLGDSKYTFRSSYTDQSIIADVSENDNILYRTNEEVESIRSLNISGNYRFEDYWQIGLSIPYISKTRIINNSWESLEGLGDVSINTAYEFYPEYSRNQFITKSFIYTGITFPTSPSLFDTKRKDLLDTRGSGHMIYTLGIVSLKNINKHSFLLNLNLSFLQGRQFNDSLFGEDIRTEDSLDNAMTLSYIYSLTDIFNSTISFSRNYTQKKPISTLSEDKSSLLNTVSIGLGVDIKDNTFNLSYMDDFFLSSSYGTILSRSLSLSYLRRINL